MSGGGRFDFDDGGTYCGGWEEGKAHGHGVCTGPKGQGEYAGAWQLGFELNGVYLWPSGNMYEGQWTQGKRHGLGAETKGRWSYKGEWTQGFKGRYGVRLSTSTGARYEGTWTTGLQDGYGVETYADGGEFKGQWLRGMRHGYGTRQSVPYGVAASYHAKTQHKAASPASHASAADADEDAGSRRERSLHRADESRGGFVLKSRSDDAAATAPGGRRSFLDKHSKGPIGKILRLSLRKQHSTGDLQDPNAGRRTLGASIRSTASTMSRLSNDSGKTAMTSGSVNTIDSNHSFVTQDDVIESGVVETYMGEWKNDKRSGFGVSERTDGLKYVGEWYNNKKYGYGVTTLRDGTKEEGKYKNNVLVTANNKSKLLFAIRSSKLRERIDSAVAAALRAGQIAKQKADIALSRMQTAKAKAELAEVVSQKARLDAEIARQKAKEFAPDFQQPGLNNYRKTSDENDYMVPNDHEYIKPQKASANHMSASTMPRANGNSAFASSANSNSAMTATYNSYPSNPGSKEITIPASSSNKQLQQQQQAGMRAPSSAASLPAAAAATAANSNNNKAATLDRQMSSNNSTIGNNKYRRQESLESAANAAALLRQRNTDSIRSHRSTGGASNTMGPGGKSSASEYGSDAMDGDDAGSYYSGSANRSRHSPSRESTVTSSDYGSVSGRSQTPRRKSLPSIVKNKEDAIAAAKAAQQQQQPGSSASSSSSASRKAQHQQHQQMRSLKPLVDYGAHYIIENGVRKRITTEKEGRGGADDGWQGEEGTAEGGEAGDLVADLPRRYRVETPRLQRRAGGQLGSLPDVSVCQELGQSVMPREEVYVLSERRRDELRRLREEEERRRHMQVVLSLYDFKDWCQQRQMVMLILALNIGLATMFFNLLR